MLLADQRADFSGGIQRVADFDTIDPFNQPASKASLMDSWTKSREEEVHLSPLME